MSCNKTLRKLEIIFISFISDIITSVRDNSDGWERISLETLINLLTQEQMQWSDFSGEPQKTLNSTQIDIICTIKCTIIKNTN